MTKWLSGYYEESIIWSAQVIKKGGLVAFPTETVYGLGANALDKIAVVKIFEVKNRPDFDPLIVHISRKEDIYLYVEKVSEDIEKLMQNFWPGPLTIVLPKKDIIPDIVTAGLKTVAIRIPNNSIALKLIEYSGVPIAAPSANPFGYISPTSAFQVAEMLNNKIDCILDGGKCQFGLESTVVMFDNNEVYLLRPGALEIEKIERVLNKSVKFPQEKKILSPGQLDKHYSPRKKMILVYPVIEEGKINYNQTLEKLEKVMEKIGNCRQVFLILPSSNFEVSRIGEFGRVEYLSDKMDYKEISCNLFEKLYLADKSNQELIVIVGVSKEGLGFSIMNRLQKAADEKY